MSKLDEFNNYRVLFGVVDEFKKLITIREYGSENKKYLQLNCSTLETSIVTEIKVNYNRASFKKTIKNTKYHNLIRDIKNNPNPKHKGISNIDNNYVLTADLCPSTKKMDLDFFRELEKLNVSPIYLCVSGLWLIKHRIEFDFLKSCKKIKIIWVNHSYNHDFVNRNISRNFMLLRHTDVEKEVLETEKLFVKQSIIPSIFFRFPGLITNRKLTKKILDLGLIPLGSEAWLAKNQTPINGSIILIHINGNEPEGLIKFKKFLNETSMNPVYI